MAKMGRPKKKQIPKKHPGGRPEKYRPELCELAGRGCMLGDTNDVLATRFGVNVATIKRWMNKYPEFCAAIKKGREEADQNVAISLYKRAIGYSHPSEELFCYQGEVTRVPTTKHYPPDTAAAIIWLGNRRPDLWRAKPEPGDGAPDNPTPVRVVVQVEDASRV